MRCWLWAGLCLRWWRVFDGGVLLTLWECWEPVGGGGLG